ncbi:hypothetical protein [Inediibacterium massiliense]|uniref:hypothetical protein n=1 Tax=Inediibacterium massiliense TaxID=1658111 RepID=UPI0006B51AF3|nr:hypothetical protein [Inediibacterium massiliense]
MYKKKFYLLICSLLMSISLSGYGECTELETNVHSHIDFCKFEERKEFVNVLDNFHKKESYNFVTVEKKSSGNDYYKLSFNPTNYIYIGELEENLPSGKGVLAEILKNENQSIVTVKYVGYFKEGRFNGYGKYFSSPSKVSKLYRAYEPLECLGIKYLEYEGYFKDGERDNFGHCYVPENCMKYDHKRGFLDFAYGPREYVDKNQNELEKYQKLLSKNTTELIFCDLPLLESQLYYCGQFEKNVFKGKGSIFLNSKLIYKGEFKYNRYHGEGTLYNEDGSIKYKGTFVYGKEDLSEGIADIYNSIKWIGPGKLIKLTVIPNN